MAVRKNLCNFLVLLPHIGQQKTVSKLIAIGMFDRVRVIEMKLLRVQLVINVAFLYFWIFAYVLSPA